MMATNKSGLEKGRKINKNWQKIAYQKYSINSTKMRERTKLSKKIKMNRKKKKNGENTVKKKSKMAKQYKNGEK